MDLNSKVTQLEDEIKVLKKEIQTVLLDLRENMLNRENPFSPQPLVMSSVPMVAVAVEEKEKAVEEKPVETPEAKEEIELPPVITGAFEADEQVEMPRKKEPKAQTTDIDEMVLAWKPIEDDSKKTCLPGAKKTDGDKPDKNVLECITSLVNWVENSISSLGFERTQAILDISEMMGHLSPEMKAILVKFMHPGPEPPEKVAFKDYMASLIELANLLGKENDPNNVLFYTLYHGMYSMAESRGKNG
jgi:archaellum component FlaD/FlaE